MPVVPAKVVPAKVFSASTVSVGIVGYGFAQGAAVQAVCEAMERSAVQGRWVAVGEVTAG